LATAASDDPRHEISWNVLEMRLYSRRVKRFVVSKESEISRVVFEMSLYSDISD